MIQVEIASNKKAGIHKILVKGHAGSGPKGHDLCCSAVSAILFGGFNALSENEAYHYDIKEGYACLDIDGEASEQDKVVLMTIMIQLQTIEASYPKNIEIQLRKE